tara:strand:+ start:256 stop:888 length:633 start_codon:yes stop_codon:yes gene_type:complete
MTIKLVGSSSGSVSLQAPASTTGGANRVLTLPDVNGTVATTTTAGKVLQVIQTVVTGTYSESFASNASSSSCGLDLNITPSATTSKILIQAVANVSNSDAIDTTCGIILFKGGSELTGAIGAADGNRERLSSQSYTPYTSGQGSGYKVVAIPFHYLDSPSSTSQQSYSIRLRYNTTSGSETVYLNRTKDDDNAYYRDRSISTITAMEIAA